MFEKLIQIGFVSKEFDRILRNFTYIYDIGPWYILKFSPENVKSMQIYGKSQDYAMNVAVCPIGDIRFEYIEPITPSIFSDFYDKHGEYAVHHLKLGGQDYEYSLDFLKSRNINSIQIGHQQGIKGENLYNFMDTYKELGFIMEIVNVSQDFIKPPPESWFPKNHNDFKPIFKKASMVGILVKDLAKKVKQYERFGIGPWQVYGFDKKTGAGIDSKMAFCVRDNIVLKLIKPNPDSIFMEYLQKFGEGINHIKMEVNDYQKTLKYLKAKDLKVIYSSGYMNENEFCFIDTRKHLNFIVEISEREIRPNKEVEFIPHP
jgi:methylmalonyl-CoA/ethylmalonyl-CoA epimerase